MIGEVIMAQLRHQLSKWAIPLLASVLITSAANAAPRLAWTSNHVTGSPNPPAPYQVTRFFPALTFDHPVDLALMPSGQRWLLLEQGGKLFSFPNRPDADHKDPAFDLSGHHQPFSSAYGLTFHPRFAENGYLFVCYAEPEGRTNGERVSRFTVRGSNPPVLDPSSEKIIVRWPTGSHCGGCLTFGNDGFLYITTGDSGNPDPPDDTFKTGQDISDLLSSILRLDVDHESGTNAYAIPADNPFVKTPGARPEVYAFGLRNPWRMSFDRPTGDLWVGDVGWEQWEMIYRVKPGGNYGWSLVEGPNTHVRTDVKPGPGPILPPLIALPHSEAASITGGRVYHGQKLPALRGAYLYGDWETGKFWALRQAGGTLTTNSELCQTALKVVSFAEDADRELRILDYNGGIYGFTPSATPPANLAFPRRLSETGLFRDLPKLIPETGVVEYNVNAGIWNDSAQAERVLGVPGSDAVSTVGGRATIAGRMWYFPSNTVFARTLTLDMQRGSPAAATSRRRIETQLFHFDGQVWNPYTFRWNAAQTDADLVPSAGTNEVFVVTDISAPGGRREIPWRFAGRAECLRCHNSWAGETLSFNWLQLNTPGPVSEVNRLEALGVLRVKDPPKMKPGLADPYDAALPLAARARSWLHVNCAGCHRFGAGGSVPSQFNFDQPLEKARALDVKPVRGDFGLQGARVIAPGDPYRSTLLYRISTEGSGHMPHLGSRLVDEVGVRLVRDWIASLPAKTGSDSETTSEQELAGQNAALLKQCQGEARGEALPKLMASMNGCLALLNADMTPDSRNAATATAATHTNLMVRDLFQRLLPPENRRHTLGADFDPQGVLGIAGNSVRGGELFRGTAQCSRCHADSGAARSFGPVLAGIGHKYTRAQLLDQIRFPSQIIAPEYKTTVITLRNGDEVSGFIIRRAAAELTLRDELLTERRIKLSEVQASRESNVSAMPEGLLAPLTAQEAADILEYLSVQRASSP